MSPPFYAMARGWLSHPVFGNRKREPFCRAAAWCWLIEEAVYKPTKVRISGKMVELQRGQLSHSLRFMAEAWGWQHDRCRRFVAELSHEGMIATETATGQLVITICNYDKYQHSSETIATEDASAVRQHCDSDATDLNKETSSLTSEAKASSALEARARNLAATMARIWREECGDLLSVPVKLDQRRIGACAARWRDSFGGDAEQFRAYCQAIRASPFCCGDSERGWRADFDWALTPKAIRGVQEGKYAKRSTGKRGSAVENLIEGFGRAAGYRPPDSGPDWSSSGPLLDGEYACYDA